MSTGDDNVEKSRGIRLMGRDLAEVPCLRSSLLGGLLGGIGLGIVHFMFTSNARRSISIAQFAPVPVALILWGSCRYDNAKKRFEAKQMQSAFQEYQGIRGTELEQQLLSDKPKE